MGTKWEVSPDCPWSGMQTPDGCNWQNAGPQTSIAPNASAKGAAMGTACQQVCRKRVAIHGIHTETGQLSEQTSSSVMQ